jgi:hypothetical protein
LHPLKVPTTSEVEELLPVVGYIVITFGKLRLSQF